MNKKICLTSLLVLGGVYPVFADEFPADDYMQENKIYENAATFDNMGIYEGDITALAEYEDMLYRIAAGQYLAAGETTGSICTAGNFCLGLTDVTYNESVNQGLTSCATVGDNTYTQSDVGAKADTDCYKACTTSSVEHASAVAGNDYYGEGVDTCYATACVSGWSIKEGFNVQTVVGTSFGANSAYISNSGVFSESGDNGQTYYGLQSSDHNSFAVDYGDNGMISGHAVCSTTSGAGYSTAVSVTDESGEEGAKYCWCKVDGFKPKGGDLQNLASSWVFSDDYGTESNCVDSCADYCAKYLREDGTNDLAFRSAVLGAVAPVLASCEANTIEIVWNGASPEAIAENDAGVCVYGGDIRTPKTAEPRKGMKFKGWKFRKPQVSSVTNE